MIQRGAFKIYMWKPGDTCFGVGRIDKKDTT